jgi:hypothetical protein
MSLPEERECKGGEWVAVWRFAGAPPGVAGSVRRARSQRGYRPAAFRIRRSTTRLSRLSFSSRAVAFPSGVSGSITAPRSTSTHCIECRHTRGCRNPRIRRAYD